MGAGRRPGQATQQGELPLQGLAIRPMGRSAFWRLDQNRLVIALSTGPVHHVGSVTDEFLEDVVAWDVHGFRPESTRTEDRPILADMYEPRSRSRRQRVEGFGTNGATCRRAVAVWEGLQVGVDGGY